MIYVTGDTHRDELQKITLFCKMRPELTKKDYLIIAGDFGGVWSPKTLEKDLKAFSDFPLTVLFVDGNHENFDLINSYPVEEWMGGKVHKIKADIIHLMRGQVFELDGLTFFTFGGGTSIDRAWRTEGKSWWKQELPTFEELDEGIAALKRYNNQVDYVITHSCGVRAFTYLCSKADVRAKKNSPEIQMLAYFEDVVTCKQWYFGHFHTDAVLGDKFTALYHRVVRIN